MSNKTKNLTGTIWKGAVAAIKRELREWYGTISVEELANNYELALEIEVLERMLARLGV